MIKRYNIVNLDGFGIDTEQVPAGDWVQYDDIKHLIPDNRVTEEEFKQMLTDGFYQVFSVEFILKLAKQKGWIKPEGET